MNPKKKRRAIESMAQCAAQPKGPSPHRRIRYSVQPCRGRFSNQLHAP